MQQITPQEALRILTEASGALSHASYCAIVGQRPREAAIQQPWDRLRQLIECIDPSKRFDAEQPKPTLGIVEIQE